MMGTTVDWPLVTDHCPLLPQTTPPPPQSGTMGCKTGFGRGFSQLTFSAERGEYLASGFPTQAQAFVLPELCWVCIRRRPARRNYL